MIFFMFQPFTPYNVCFPKFLIFALFEELIIFVCGTCSLISKIFFIKNGFFYFFFFGKCIYIAPAIPNHKGRFSLPLSSNSSFQTRLWQCYRVSFFISDRSICSSLPNPVAYPSNILIHSFHLLLNDNLWVFVIPLQLSHHFYFASLAFMMIMPYKYKAHILQLPLQLSCPNAHYVSTIPEHFLPEKFLYVFCN
jgi:hypothetical protein